LHHFRAEKCFRKGAHPIISIGVKADPISKCKHILLQFSIRLYLVFLIAIFKIPEVT